MNKKFKYSINNVNMNTDDNIIDLGITFDSKLKFDLINSLLSECSKLLGFICYLVRFCYVYITICNWAVAC